MTSLVTGDRVNVVIAPDKFRGSLTADEAAEAIAAGVRQVLPCGQLRLIPVADGGEGTVRAALAAGYRPVTVTVDGPDGGTVDAVFAVRDETAVVELAQASGLGRLAAGPGPNSALTATSHGGGQLVACALDDGSRRIVLGVGGSACTDGGTGLARALGVRFLDRCGQPVAAGGAGLAQIAAVDVRDVHPRLAGAELVIATDVDNPLTGPHGAAAVYGPQKGADARAVDLLDAGLRHLADTVRRVTGISMADVPGAGAAGGIAACAVPLLGATLASGSDVILRLLGLDAALTGAALVITGEGSLDAQSLHGKAPHGVARISAAHRVPVIALAGRVDVSSADLAAAGITAAYSLASIENDTARCMSNAGPLLTRLASRAAREWLAGHAT